MGKVSREEAVGTSTIATTRDNKGHLTKTAIPRLPTIIYMFLFVSHYIASYILPSNKRITSCVSKMKARGDNFLLSPLLARKTSLLPVLPLSYL